MEAYFLDFLENIKRKIAEGLLIPILRQRCALPGEESPFPTLFWFGFKSGEGFGKNPHMLPTQSEQERHSFWYCLQSALGPVFQGGISALQTQDEDVAFLRTGKYPICSRCGGALSVEQNGWTL